MAREGGVYWSDAGTAWKVRNAADTWLVTEREGVCGIASPMRERAVAGAEKVDKVRQVQVYEEKSERGSRIGNGGGLWV